MFLSAHIASCEDGDIRLVNGYTEFPGLTPAVIQALPTTCMTFLQHLLPLHYYKDVTRNEVGMAIQSLHFLIHN